MPIGLKCKIQILEDKISKTRKLMSTAKQRYGKKLEKMRKNLVELKRAESVQFERRVTGVPTNAQLRRRRRRGR